MPPQSHGNGGEVRNEDGGRTPRNEPWRRTRVAFTSRGLPMPGEDVEAQRRDIGMSTPRRPLNGLVCPACAGGALGEPPSSTAAAPASTPRAGRSRRRPRSSTPTAVLLVLVLCASLLAPGTASSAEGSAAAGSASSAVTVPDHPEPLSYDPNSMKGIKAADPSAGINLIAPPRANNTGDAQLSYAIELPPGRMGMQPQVGLTYNSSGGNGWVGLGWDLRTPAITADTRWGVPRYDKTMETESYLVDGQQLTPMAHRGQSGPRNGTDQPRKEFYARVEGGFRRIIRNGASPSTYSWEVTDKAGTRYLYGGNGSATDPTTLTDDEGNIFTWALREVRDVHGNGMTYHYDRIPFQGAPGGAGSQLYLSNINYTQANGAPGAYTVTFARETGRPDVIIDGRGGFKMVTAERLAHITVSARKKGSTTDETIRSYDLAYEEGAFRKSRLKSITQRGENGDVLGSPHEFTYYADPLGFDARATWKTGDDGVKGPALVSHGEASALSGAVTHSLGTHLYAGFNPFGPTKQASVGAKLGGTISTTQGALAMADLDGDGLPDKVFCAGWGILGLTCNAFEFRRNLSGPDGGTTFSDPPTPVNLRAISRDSSLMGSFGLEAYFGASILGNIATTFNLASSYLSDVNADGFTDLVDDGQVWFNHLDENKVPTFTKSSGATPVPLPTTGAPVDAAGVVPDFGPVRQQNLDTFPLHDTFRRWVAPYDGTIQVTGTAALVKDQSPERQEYQSADGVRVAIQRNGTELWSTTIAAGDYAPKTPTGVQALSVTRGDRIYFRVQSRVDGRYDQVSWAPEIAYTGASSVSDVNGLDPYRYFAADDFVLAGRPGINAQVPITGSVRLTGTLQKDNVTTDDVTLLVEKSGQAVFTKTLPSDQTGTISLAEDIDVTRNSTMQDTVSLRIRADSPIDLRQLRWEPDPLLTYTAAADPKQPIVDAEGKPLVQVHPPYDIDMYPVDDLTAPQQAWTAPQTGTFIVATGLGVTPFGDGKDRTVTFTIKRRGELSEKRTILINDDGAYNTAFHIEATQGDQLYFDYSVSDPAITSRVTGRTVIVEYQLRSDDPSLPPRVVRVAAANALHSAASAVQTNNGLFGQPYRGWSYAGYNGNDGRAAQPIDESRLLIDKDRYTDGDKVDEKCKNDDYVESSIKDGFEKSDVDNAPCSAAEETAYAFAPLPGLGGWQGPDDLGWVKRTATSSSRLGADTVDVPDAGDFGTDPSGAPARAVSRLSRTTQVAVTAGLGPLGFSGSTGPSTSEVDYLDMNGDRFPDVVGNGRVQYTNPDGSLTDGSTKPDGMTGARQSDSVAGNVSLGGSTAMFDADAKGRVATGGTSAPKDNSSGSQMPPFGLGFSASLGAGASHVASDLQDFNGDGLPDIVTREVVKRGELEVVTLKVALNLGYRFAPPEPWGDADINAGQSENGSLGLSPSYNGGIYDFAGGVSVSKNKSTSNDTLVDVNGDGLLDHVAPKGDTFSIRFNSGAGFSAATQWSRTLPDGTCGDAEFGAVAGGIDWDKAGVCDGSTSRSAGLYFTIGLPIPIPFCACNLILNSGSDISDTMARQEAALRDVDGDNLVDLVGSTSDGALQVGRNLIGRTNLLKSVKRPLGATIDIDYQRDGNTDLLPQSRWVMSKVSVADGHPGDGADVQVTTYRYDGGRYDRLEREFLGYERVTEGHPKGAGGDLYRSVVRNYLNGNHYEMGLLLAELTKDGAENPFVDTTNDYILRDVVSGAVLADTASTTARVFPELHRTDYRFFEGKRNPGKSSHSIYGYDEFGNTDELFDAGDPGDGDDRVTRIAYSKCEDSHIVGKPVEVIVTGNGTQMRHRTAEIKDCATGNVTQVREFINGTQSADTALDYYQNGTLKSVEGPKNLHGDRDLLTYEYDDHVQTHIASIKDRLGYTSRATYDTTYGVPETTLDVNRNKTTYTYDAFGRPKTITGPYEQEGGSPTISFEYHPEATVPWALTSHLDSFRSKTDPIQTAVFVDGLGRVLQTKKDATVHRGTDRDPDDVMIVSGRVTFDSFGRMTEQRHPVTESLKSPGAFNTSSSPVDPTVMDYDVLDRNVKTTLPDKTATSTTYGFGSDRAGATQFETTVTDANQVQKKTYRGIREEVVATQESNRRPDGTAEVIWTSYGYDPLGQLLEVKDDKSNVTSVAYDLLGRRTVLDNPDSGRTETVYDAASNAIATITPNLRAEGKQVSYDYDLHGLTAVAYPNFPGNNLTYAYGPPGAPNNRAGRITKVTDESGAEERFYGKLGEVTKEIRTVASDTQGGSANAPEVYSTEYVYDWSGRLQRLTYPDGEVLTYRYDSGGLLREAAGKKGDKAYAYLKTMQYDEFGERVFVEAGNGIRTQYAYRADNRRLKSVTATKPGSRPFQNLMYDYDKVGNILELKNDVAVPKASELGGPTTQTFTYDGLYRLTSAKGTYQHEPNKLDKYTLSMSYDTIHNITSKTQVHEVVQPSGSVVGQQRTTYDWTYRYDGRQPHAATHIGDQTFSYDANGNQLGWQHDQNGTRRTIVWDEANRMQSVTDNGQETTFKYDDGGERVIKRQPQGETAYVNQYFSIRNREVGTKHVWAGSTRLVSKTMKQDKPGAKPSGNNTLEKDQYFFHPDHLRSSNYVTNTDGNTFQHGEFFAFGEMWVDESSGTQRTPYLYTGKEFDEESGLHYFGARYYDSRQGQWVGTDPALPSRLSEGSDTALNPYAYARNNPLTFTDPDGETEVRFSDEEGMVITAPPSVGEDQLLEQSQANMFDSVCPTCHRLAPGNPVRPTSGAEKAGVIGAAAGIAGLLAAPAIAGAGLSDALFKASVWIAVRFPKTVAALLAIGHAISGTPSMPARARFVNGEMFETVISTKAGDVGVLAQVVVNGRELVLKDVAIFGMKGNLVNQVGVRDFVAAKSELARQAAADGFQFLRIVAERSLQSSSGNPGHAIDIVVPLTKAK